MNIDYFGYLERTESYCFESGKITVVEDFEKTREWVAEYINEDGFLYPPITKRIRLDPLTKEETVVPKTERPSLLHKLFSSHSIEIYHSGTIEEQRKGPSVFILNLLGFLFGCRLQFHDWWFDGRVPIKGNNNLSVNKSAVEDFLFHCFSIWKSWDAESQKLITNLLYMFSRSPQYEWEWERFMVDYMVIDGIWKLHKKFRRIRDTNHSQRIKEMCEAYDIPIHDDYITKIVDLRNDLFHETLWDGGQPCNAGGDVAFMQSVYIRKLIMRLITAVLDYRNSFVKTEWWHIGRLSFDKRE